MQTIERIVDGRESPGPVLSASLHLLSLAYESAVRLRLLCYRHSTLRRRLPCRIVSIGNLTVGGTGKTPMTQYAAILCRSLGYKVVVVSRGYKGAAEKRGGVVSDGGTLRMTAAEAGDEPFLIASSLPGIPVLVGRDRFAAGMRAVTEFQPDVILLDDAFQHLRLERDIDLVLLDRSRPLGNGYLLPRGPLREPLAALSRGDAFIFTRADGAAGALPVRLRNRIAGKPSFETVHRPYIAAVICPTSVPPAAPSAGLEPPSMAALENRRVFLFSGIARGKDFRETIREHGAVIAASLEFGDHHAYSAADLDKIRKAASDSRAEIMITTEKDFARIGGDKVWPMELYVIGVRIDFRERADEFEAFFRRKLAGADHPQQTEPT